MNNLYTEFYTALLKDSCYFHPYEENTFYVKGSHVFCGMNVNDKQKNMVINDMLIQGSYLQQNVL